MHQIILTLLPTKLKKLCTILNDFFSSSNLMMLTPRSFTFAGILRPWVWRSPPTLVDWLRDSYVHFWIINESRNGHNGSIMTRSTSERVIMFRSTLSTWLIVGSAWLISWLGCVDSDVHLWLGSTVHFLSGLCWFWCLSLARVNLVNLLSGLCGFLCPILAQVNLINFFVWAVCTLMSLSGPSQPVFISWQAVRILLWNYKTVTYSSMILG